MTARSARRQTAALELPAVDAASGTGDAIRAALGSSVVRLVSNERAVRAGEDPEAIHQARVATRRLRSDLRTFAPLLDPAWVGTLRERLAEVASELGEVRDADVMLERLRASAAALQQPDAAERVFDVLRAARRQHRTRLLRSLDGASYRGLVERLLAAAAEPQLTVSADEPAAATLPPLVRACWRRLRRRVAELSKKPSDDELHQVRIAAKRARYAAEAAAPVAGVGAERFARRLALLQTHLGDLHDAVVAADWLRAQYIPDAADALVVGQLIGMQLERAAQLRAAWRGVWRRASANPLRHWM